MAELIIKGDFDKNYVESAILQLYLKHGIPSKVEYILVIDDPKYYKVMEKKIPKKARKEFREAYESDPTSMSLTYNKFDLIIISVSLKEELYLKKDKKALIGLLAHELMHVRQRRRNLDRSVRADAIRAFKKFKPKLKKLDIPEGVLADFFADIGESANFTLKDIYANFELIDNGMGDYILEDYWNLYWSDAKFIKPRFYSIKDSGDVLIKHVQNAIDFELNLISAISPFVKMARNKHSKARELVEFISDNYESKIPEIASSYDEVIQYAIDKFSWSSRFRKGYYKRVFERSLDLLENIKLKHSNFDRKGRIKARNIITKKKGSNK